MFPLGEVLVNGGGRRGGPIKPVGVGALREGTDGGTSDGLPIEKSANDPRTEKEQIFFPFRLKQIEERLKQLKAITTLAPSPPGGKIIT